MVVHPRPNSSRSEFEKNPSRMEPVIPITPQQESGYLKYKESAGTGGEDIIYQVGPSLPIGHHSSGWVEGVSTVLVRVRSSRNELERSPTLFGVTLSFVPKTWIGEV